MMPTSTHDQHRRPPPEHLTERLLALAGQGRTLVAIAGPPGSGKSTIAENACRDLNTRHPGVAAIVPMDGFHFDDAILREKGILSRKGAPSTFDVGGFKALLQRLRANADAEIAIPVFDRSLEISRAGARTIPQETRLLLVEGNYLLLDCEPWTKLSPFFDMTIWLDVPERELERRLIQRWVTFGFSHADADMKARGNDLPNAALVKGFSRAADITLSLP
jgi:pantothenate kinase